MEKMTVSQAKKAISDKLSHFFGVDTKTAGKKLKGRTAKKFIIFVWNSLWAAHLKIIFTILI